MIYESKETQSDSVDSQNFGTYTFRRGARSVWDNGRVAASNKGLSMK